MPNLETPDELADAIADMVGVYGACAEILDEPCAGKCRPHFVSEMTNRIREAAANEALLAARSAKPQGGEAGAAQEGGDNGKA